MPKSILVVDDESNIRRMITRYLKEETYTVYEAADGLQALDILRNNAVDLVLLDLMMPRLDGEGFVKEARRFSDVYIIILTAKAGEDSQVGLYGLGADDYIEKPFSCKALLSKISAVFNRISQKTYGQRVINPEGLSIDNTARKAYVNGADCNLKPKEFELLAFLSNNRNFALSREQILNGVWGQDYFGGDRTVDIHVSRLRKKLGGHGKSIRTVSNYGYKWEATE